VKDTSRLMRLPNNRVVLAAMQEALQFPNLLGAAMYITQETLFVRVPDENYILDWYMPHGPGHHVVRSAMHLLNSRAIRLVVYLNDLTRCDFDRHLNGSLTMKIDRVLHATVTSSDGAMAVLEAELRYRTIGSVFLALRGSDSNWVQIAIFHQDLKPSLPRHRKSTLLLTTQ
jgi:hypothetical protein